MAKKRKKYGKKKARKIAINAMFGIVLRVYEDGGMASDADILAAPEAARVILERL